MQFHQKPEFKGFFFLNGFIKGLKQLNLKITSLRMLSQTEGFVHGEQKQLFISLPALFP